MESSNSSLENNFLALQITMLTVKIKLLTFKLEFYIMLHVCQFNQWIWALVIE